MYSVNVKKYNKLSHIEKRASIWAIYIVVNGKGLGVVRKPWWEPNHLDCGEGLMGLGREDLGGLKARGSLGEMEDYIRLLLTTFRTLAHNIKKKKKNLRFWKKLSYFQLSATPLIWFCCHPPSLLQLQKSGLTCHVAGAGWLWPKIWFFCFWFFYLISYITSSFFIRLR